MHAALVELPLCRAAVVFRIDDEHGAAPRQHDVTVHRWQYVVEHPTDAGRHGRCVGYRAGSTSG